MTFINNKRSKQFFYPLNSNYGRKFTKSPSHQVLLKVSHRQIPNFSRPSTRFPKQFKDFFSFMTFKDFSRLVLNSRPVQEPCEIHRRHLIDATKALSILTAIFPGKSGLASFVEANDDRSGGDNCSYKSCKASVKSSPPTNQQPTFYRPDALPVTQPTVSKH